MRVRAILIIIIVIMLSNRKVRVFPELVKQFKVFKNADTNKISIYDLLSFFVMPIILAGIIVIGYGCKIDNAIAEVLTTVFTFVFTILFGYATLLVGKLDSDNSIEKQVVGETFITIMTSNILSLLTVIISIVIINNHDNFIGLFLSICAYSFSFIIVMLLLMILKRTFIIYNQQEKK